MAETVSKQTPAGWWPVDVVVVLYLVGTSALIAANFSEVPDAGLLLAIHAAEIILLAGCIRLTSPNHGASLVSEFASRLASLFRHWYPVVYVGFSYREMAMLIRAIRGIDYDAEMAALDYRFWGVHPTVWLERIQSPGLTEYLQIIYTLFLPVVLGVATVLWLQRRYSEFRYYAFLLTLGFLTSYVGYFLVPVRGPRFFLADLQHTDLRGLWLFGNMQQALDRLESAHYDCFPSGHTALTLLAWWASRRISMKCFAALSLFSVSIVFATVYLRYHYTVDVLAGAALAAVVLVAAPLIYAAGRRRGQRN